MVLGEEFLILSGKVILRPELLTLRKAADTLKNLNKQSSRVESD
jgi:hypothetical protein